MRRSGLLLALWLPLAGGSAWAHHGVATVGLSGPEGPGAALETSSPLPLPRHGLFSMLKSELVPFRRLAHAEPENKDFSSFNTLGLGFGVSPWLSAYLFQPFNVKAQDGFGASAGPGDPNLMLAVAFKLDEGLRLVPERESLDELEDWHFAAWASCTVPVAPSERRDRSGQFFAPDMQTGFGAPSQAGGLSALKQLSEDLTWMAGAGYQHFPAHRYSFTRYQFGGETRLDSALVWRAWGSEGARLDLSGELNGLHLQRDREAAPGGALSPLQASGGAILYASVGGRLSWRTVSAALGLKRAIATALNEGARQQGSEGLELLRASLSVSWSPRL